MTRKVSMNRNWKFQSIFDQDMMLEQFDSTKLEEIELPHTNKVLPFHYFDESEYQMICGYRKEFYADQSWMGQQILIEFEAVAHKAEVFV